jgi:hypothetical protein
VSRGATPPISGSGLRYVADDERRTVFGPGLRLTFSRVGDRWSHALAIQSGPLPAFAEVVGTVEGDPARDDPARVVSPAYQDIQEHACDDGVQLLLTGQSTPHHASAVVTVRRIGDGVRIEFDVADRCRARVEMLAATYLVALGSGALLDAESGRITWGGDALGLGRLAFASDPPGSVSLAEAGRRGTRVQALARVAPAAATHRLVYRWEWTPPSPSMERGPVDLPAGPGSPQLSN